MDGYVDVCMRSTQIFNHTRRCTRTGDLLYPLDGLWTVPDASVFARLLNDGSTSPGMPARSRRAARASSASSANGKVSLQANRFAQESYWGKIPDYPGLPFSQPAVWDGFDQLEAATKGRPCLVVAFTDRYFEG